jgi:cellulose biosynthesis protein BcsQ
MIVLIGGEKGGTGKTTVATNLAARGFNPGLRAAVLLSLASTHPFDADTADARLALEGLSPLTLADTVLYVRKAYRRSARLGRAVTELERPDAKAANELRLLCEEIYHG